MSASAKLPCMNIAFRKPMTREEFFTWAEAQEERYEFDGFHPVAMTGGSGNHSRITGSINFQLRLRLGKGPCEALGSDAGVATVDERVRYPDALVTCTRFDGRDHTVSSPVIVFEVVSASSTRTDRIVKVNEYHAVPSIKRYIIVEQTVIGLSVLWRQHQDDPWSVLTLTDGDVLNLPEIGIEIPVNDLYDRVNFSILDDTDPAS